MSYACSLLSISEASIFFPAGILLCALFPFFFRSFSAGVTDVVELLIVAGLDGRCRHNNSTDSALHSTISPSRLLPRRFCPGTGRKPPFVPDGRLLTNCAEFSLIVRFVFLDTETAKYLAPSLSF
jgi:hypothetical protein